MSPEGVRAAGSAMETSLTGSSASCKWATRVASPPSTSSPGSLKVGLPEAAWGRIAVRRWSWGPLRRVRPSCPFHAETHLA